jgi:hypothetical protein
MDCYKSQKIRFSSIQSAHHKLLNTLRDKTYTPLQLQQLLAINETFEILESQIMDFNENHCSVSKEELENIKKNNNTIDFLKQFAILHRFLQD